jgi:hypothetical protein
VSQRSYIKGFCDRRTTATTGLTHGDAQHQQQHQQKRPRPRRRLAVQGGQTETETGAAAIAKGEGMQNGQWAVDPRAFYLNVMAFLLSAALTLVVLKARIAWKG